MKKYLVLSTVFISMSIEAEWLPERLVSLAGLTWVTLDDKNMLEKKIIAGQEDGQSIAICRGKYSGPFGVSTGRYPGKLTENGKCYIKWEGRQEVIRSQRDVLVLVNTDPSMIVLKWVQFKGKIPGNAVIGGTERRKKRPEKVLYICRAHDKHGSHLGYLADKECEVTSNNRGKRKSDFELLTVETPSLESHDTEQLNLDKGSDIESAVDSQTSKSLDKE